LKQYWKKGGLYIRVEKEEALRWLSQAEHNLLVAKHNLVGKFYSDACFMSEQASQVALKAFITSKKRRRIVEHSVQELASICSNYDKDFKEVIEYGKTLDRYYIPTRYPDALASPAVPFKTYKEEDAADAISLAQKIITVVKSKL
jgi:HEPN domain-containing protein